MRLTVGSVFAGIGGFDEGFRRAGFVVQWHCEIEPWCRRTLERHFPDAVCFSDVAEIGSGATVVERAQRIKARTWPDAITSSEALQRARAGIIRDDLRVDVLVGGFPCQDVSVAGQRTGLSGKRSGLYFEFMRLVRELQPRWVVIENVPGLLSSQRGRDFHAVLAEMAHCRLRRAYRILDSQYFGVPQRRRRVFLIGRAGDGGAEQVLLEPNSLHRRAQTDRETGARIASTLRGRSAKRGVNEPGRGGEDDVNLICFDWQSGGDVRHTYSSSSSSLQASQVPAIYQCHGFNVGPMGTLRSGNGNIGGGVPFTVAGERERALVGSMHKRHDDDTDTLIPTVAPTLDRSLGHHRGSVGVGDFLVPFDTTQITHPVTASAGHHGHSSPRGDGRDNIVAATLLAPSGGQRTTDLNGNFQPTAMGVRRLTPLECERLQGFPDGWTCLCGEGHKGSRFCTCPDTPRYKALGNAVTVNVAQWVAERLKEAEMGRNGTRESCI
jgi:DNA (cytosine-5)-methyltransferase 1